MTCMQGLPSTKGIPQEHDNVDLSTVSFLTDSNVALALGFSKGLLSLFCFAFFFVAERKRQSEYTSHREEYLEAPVSAMEPPSARGGTLQLSRPRQPFLLLPHNQWRVFVQGPATSG